MKAFSIELKNHLLAAWKWTGGPFKPVVGLSGALPGDEKNWSALENDFRTFLLMPGGSESIFQQFTA